jgi:hypothetical protein
MALSVPRAASRLRWTPRGIRLARGLRARRVWRIATETTDATSLACGHASSDPWLTVATQPYRGVGIDTASFAANRPTVFASRNLTPWPWPEKRVGRRFFDSNRDRLQDLIPWPFRRFSRRFPRVTRHAKHLEVRAV